MEMRSLWFRSNVPLSFRAAPTNQISLILASRIIILECSTAKSERESVGTHHGRDGRLTAPRRSLLDLSCRVGGIKMVMGKIERRQTLGHLRSPSRMPQGCLKDDPRRSECS